MVRALFLHKGGTYVWRRDNRRYRLVGKAKDWMSMDDHALIVRVDDPKRIVIVLPLNAFCLEFNLLERVPGVTPPKEEKFNG